MDKNFILTFFILPIVPSIILYIKGQWDISLALLSLFFNIGILCIISRKFENTLKNFFKKIGEILSKLTLIFGYVFVVLPTAFMGFIFKRDRLNIKKNKNKVSYWIDETQEYDYERQF